MKKTSYNDMLRDDIREFMSLSSCKNLNDMIARAQEREIDLELLRKQRPVQKLTSEGQDKRPKTADSRTRGHQGRGCCAKFQKNHEDECREKGMSSFRCGQTDYISKDCPHGSLICFHCNQKSHKRADCPRLTGRAVVEPVPATLRITDGL